MKRLEKERMQELEQQTAVKQMTLESDTTLQNLNKVGMGMGYRGYGNEIGVVRE